MKFIFRYVKPYTFKVILAIFFKAIAAAAELLIPYAMEYMLDTAAPNKDSKAVVICALIMLFLTACIFGFNIVANMMSVKTSSMASETMRKDLFWKSLKLSGKTFDDFGLPSITSRMTADSYNFQDFTRMFQSIGIRAPFMLLGGIIVSLGMDAGLGLILCIIAPITVAAVLILSFKGIPLYEKVQSSLDEITLVMRENITGVRVVKALSKEPFESERYDKVNGEMMKREKVAGIVMALPGPAMTLFLNIGLVLVVLIGAQRVNVGLTAPAVILAFLTYFNMILQGAMGLSRVILMMSKASASAHRIQAVVDMPEELVQIPDAQAAHTNSNAKIVFDHVSFKYGDDSKEGNSDGFAGEERLMSLSDINFEIKEGESLGIIGPTGCGKTSIINLLMRFYDTTKGNVFVDGKDVRSYNLTELRRKFGVTFQNDMIFADTVEENIKFGRDVSDERMVQAATDACVADFIDGSEGKYTMMSASHGTNFSGGQKQRIMISRALVGNPEILVLDDASSALDYKTDADLRSAIRKNYHCTSIIIAQRISSIMSSSQIIVMDEGKIIGIGTHEYLMENCKEYQDIYKIQMGEEA